MRYSKIIWPRLEHYFSYRLINEGSLNPDHLYIFGYHPHGIYPFAAIWATRCETWFKAYPNMNIDVLVATILFYLPFVRDLAMWFGGRDATKVSIANAFEQGRSILLIPGAYFHQVV
jgi:hypothetical protein